VFFQIGLRANEGDLISHFELLPLPDIHLPLSSLPPVTISITGTGLVVFLIDMPHHQM